MLSLAPARLLALVVLFTPACGKKSSSSDDGPPVVIYQVADLQLTSLEVVARSERNGELTNAVDVQVNYPIHLSFGITQTGGTAETQISFGLMQQVAADDPAAAEGTQRTCFLGSTGANHPGDGKEMHYEATFTVPPECAPENESTVYNVYAGIDVPGQVEKTEAEDDGTIVIYNEDLLEESRNQNCKLNDGTAGCIIAVTVHPSPGVNLAFPKMEAESSVAVLAPLDENTGGTDPDGNPVNEVHPPFAKVQSTVTLAGVNTDDASTVTDKNAMIKYSVCPETLFHDTCSGDGWLPLTVSTPDTANKRSGHAANQAVADLSTGKPSVYNNVLFAEGATYAAMTTGDWSADTTFIVRGCIASDIEEKAAGTDDGTIAMRDNCTTQKVTVIRTDNSFRKSFATINQFTGTTSAYTFTEELLLRAGDPKSVRVDTTMGTENVMNLDGASTRNELIVALAGRVNIRAANTYAKAAAYVSLTGSYIEFQQSILQVSLFHYYYAVPEEYRKEAIIGYTREACAVYGLNALVIVLQGSMCVGGKAGLEGVLTVKAKQGGGAPFDAAQRVGSISVSFGPIASIYANTSVTGGSELARGGITGELRLVELTAPVTGELNWGVTNLTPVTLGIKGTVTAKAQLAALDGDIKVFADLREIDICTKSWKICGKRFRMKYPCGFRWDRVYQQTLVDFTGASQGVTLLSRSANLTLN